uniref:Uncharacterized protein n=1 Tax=Arundo donax TaxID=35708 RepID=A0A0A9FGV0_ARUDO
MDPVNRPPAFAIFCFKKRRQGLSLVSVKKNSQQQEIVLTTKKCLILPCLNVLTLIS